MADTNNVGSRVYGYTNFTEIDETLDLFWTNDVNPAKVSMGFGFYGRSFTLADSSCSTPGCLFKSTGTAGPCTQSPGTLSYAEIESIIANNHVTPVLDHAAAVKYIVWNENQWVSYDDEETLKVKVEYANSRSIGGSMVWAASTDNRHGNAIRALSNVNGCIQSLLQGESLDQPSGLTQCVWGECAVSGKTSCPAGQAPAQRSDHPGKRNVGIFTGCPKGQERPFCCPEDDVPSCQRVGTAPSCAHADCKQGQVAVASSCNGVGKTCSSGHKNLCCSMSKSDIDYGLCRWEGGGSDRAKSGYHDDDSIIFDEVTCDL